MRYSLLSGIAIAAALAAPPLSAQRTPATVDPARAPMTAPETGGGDIPVSSHVIPPPATPLKLRDGATFTGLSGYYDYQANGMMHGRLVVPKNDPSKVYSVYMLATDPTDSASIGKSRRVGYGFSTDGGATWKSTQEIQAGFRLGFPYLAVAANGTPYIATHGDIKNDGTRTLIYTGVAGGTTFTRTGTYERTSVTGRSGDDGAGVIWPAMVISPKDPTKQVVVATLSPKKNEEDDYLHLSTADLGHDGAWDALKELETAKSSGGRNIMAVSPGGKIGLAYYHRDTLTKPGIYFVESVDGGATWGTPVLAMDARTMINDGADSIIVGTTLDMVYNGEEPQIVTSGSTDLLYVQQGLFYWTANGGMKQIVLNDSTIGLGQFTAFVPSDINLQTKSQPNFPFIGYPSLSVGDDGQHVVCVFQAAAQTTRVGDSTYGDAVISPDGFSYFRLWAIGSPDGGQTWGQPRIIQNFAGSGTDSASIEYPTTAETGHVSNRSFELSLSFQARRFPGMYAFVVADIDAATDGDQPADRGPINPCFQYFQRLTLDPTFFGQSASVDNGNAVKSGLGISLTRSFPNPASGAVTVDYRLPTSGAVSLKLYNSLGSQVLTAVDGENGYAGGYTRNIDVSTLPAGHYRMVLAQNGNTVSQPVNIVR
ncbi:MAG: hypothetical protein JWQ98_2142 [Chlorobi bacterium]|nr:hypothetical protein [Chlorobiota bacterium]